MNEKNFTKADDKVSKFGVDKMTKFQEEVMPVFNKYGIKGFLVFASELEAEKGARITQGGILPINVFGDHKTMSVLKTGADTLLNLVLKDFEALNLGDENVRTIIGEKGGKSVEVENVEQAGEVYNSFFDHANTDDKEGSKKALDSMLELYAQKSKEKNFKGGKLEKDLLERMKNTTKKLNS